MNIRPVDPSKTPGASAGRAGEATPVERDERTVPKADKARPASDHIELSDAALELQAKLGLDTKSISQLSPEQLRHVLERLSSGYYDRNEVRDEVLRRLAGDLGTEPPSS